MSPVDQILEHDWDSTTHAINGCFDELVSFYEENDIPHMLGRGTDASARDSALDGVPPDGEERSSCP